MWKDMKTITIEEFMAFEPCSRYPESRIREIAGSKAKWSALDILALESVPASDRLWAVLHEELIDTRVLCVLTCIWLERTLAYTGTSDPCLADAIQVKRAWLRGEASEEELEQATMRAATWKPMARPIKSSMLVQISVLPTW
jgi:hypothetical protein